VAVPLIAKGVALGLGAAVPIGPVNVEIARRTLRGGRAAGVALGCGAVTVDVVYAVLASVGLGPALNRKWLYWPLAVGGVALLAYLGVRSLAAGWRARREDPLVVAADAGAARAGLRGTYVTGVLMTLFNPITLGFWFVVLPSQVGMTGGNPAHDLPRVCAGVFLGALSWVILFTSALAWLGNFRRGWWLVAADVVGGVILLGFAAAAFLRSVRSFL